MQQRIGKMEHFKLENKSVVHVADVLEWGKWFETSDRRVALTEVNGKTVSTVFVGIDLGFGENEKPLVFETMTFGDGTGEEIRTATWEEAEAAHQVAVEAIS
jgi:hypothetical protein